MLRMLTARPYVLVGVLAACASSERLDEGLGLRDATGGTGGQSTGMGHGGGSGSGGFAASGGAGEGGEAGTVGGSAGTGGSGGTGGVDIDASGGAGGVPIDASAGRGGFSGTAGHDASRGDTGTMDAAAADRDDADRITETDGTAGGDAEGGTCGPTFCFDVFECWFLFPQCGYTVCELLTCKK